jgi:hypothetical protein
MVSEAETFENISSSMLRPTTATQFTASLDILGSLHLLNKSAEMQFEAQSFMEFT